MLPKLPHPDRLNESVSGAEVSAMAAWVGRDAFLRQQTKRTGALMRNRLTCPDLAESGGQS